MSRSERLLTLLQLLRGHRYAITGAELASQLGISLRTLPPCRHKVPISRVNRGSAMCCVPASCCRH